MRMNPAYRPAAAIILLGILVVMVSVIAQLATENGILQAIWASITVVGIAGMIGGVVLVARVYRRITPHDPD